ncbi:MAG: helix-turn-helix transcriptional regulator [Spirochaetaceae bacterium]|nr:helix-turn-helix transcriptional regulator [Spirochaetaceae bacterium]
MMYAIAAFFALAFLSSSAALALLIALRRRDGSELALAVARIELCIFVVLVANAIGMIRETLGAMSDLVLEFALMGVVVVALERCSRQLLSVTALAMGARLSARLQAWYGAAAGALYAAVVLASIVLPSAGGSLEFRNEDGFSLSSYFGSLVAVACAVALFASRRRLEAGTRRTILGTAALISGISLFSCANEAFELARYLGLAQLPLSPLLLVAQNAIVIVLASRELSRRAATAPGAATVPGAATAGRTAAPRVIAWGDPALEEATARLADKAGLSEREREVLRLILAGADNARIGETLYISTFTVKNHVHNVFKKTGASSRLELLRIAGTPGARDE